MSDTTSSSLQTLRAEIDAIDRELIMLLHERILLVHEVGKYKKQHNLPALDKQRWQAVMESRVAQGEEIGLNPEFVRDLYQKIHDEAVRIEEEVV